MFPPWSPFFSDSVTLSQRPVSDTITPYSRLCDESPARYNDEESDRLRFSRRQARDAVAKAGVRHHRPFVTSL
jgi:hypothetical protein